MEPEQRFFQEVTDFLQKNPEKYNTDLHGLLALLAIAQVKLYVFERMFIEQRTDSRLQERYVHLFASALKGASEAIRSGKADQLFHFPLDWK